MTDCLLSTLGELHSYVDMPERLEYPASGRNRQHPDEGWQKYLKCRYQYPYLPVSESESESIKSIDT